MAVLLAAALVLQGAATEVVLRGPEQLRAYVDQARKGAEPAVIARFQLELPFVPDRKTDISSLQNPAGWSYDPRSGVLTLDVDFGAITPDNYKDFDRQALQKLPPLRTLFFWSRYTRDTTYRFTPDRAGEGSSTQGWLNYTDSLGLAIATNARSFGVEGGDLPEGFSLPVLMKLRAPPQASALLARSLRLRVEGELRTLGGRSVMCSRDTGQAYAVDQYTQNTPNVVADHQCFLPAVVTSIALVRTTGGPPLKVWTRANAEPTAETPDAAVVMAGPRGGPKPDILHGPASATPGSTAPLPQRPPS